MANSYFIDGLQTREEKARSVRRSTTFSGGDPLVTRSRQVRTTYPQAAPAKKPAPKPVTPTRRTEQDYRRNVLGIVDDADLILSSEDLKSSRKKARKFAKSSSKKRSKSHKKRRLALAVLVVLVGVGAVAYFWGDSIISRMTGGNAGLFDIFRSALLADGNAKFKTDGNGRTNILVFGTSGYDMEGDVGETVHDGAQLTDSIMVLSLDQESGDTAIVSVQRDLLVGTCTSVGKINEVYFCANPYGDDETAGALALEKTVSEVLGLDLQYYVHINWGSLVSIVDALDGITVTLDEDIEDDWTNTYIRAGVPTRVNGEQALGLARARHGTIGGDFSRAASQQKILIALKDRITERGLNLIELLNLASVLGDNFRTDFSADEISAGAKLITKTDFGAIRQVPLVDADGESLLTTGMIDGVSYVLPTAGEYNYGALRDFLANRITNAEPEESANILVLNGSGVTGIAAAEREELVNAGFKVIDIGDAPAGDYFDKYYLYAVGNSPKTLEKLETYYNIQSIDREFLPDDINTDGVDFVVILGIAY